MPPLLSASNTHLNMHATRSWLGTLGTALLLIGCTTFPMAPAATSTIEPASVETAERAKNSGEYVVAARQFEQLAETAHPPQKQTYLLNAVESLIKGGWLKSAHEKLDTISVNGLAPDIIARKRILEARLALADGAPAKAVVVLDSAARSSGLNPAVQADLYEARAQAELALNRPFAATQQLAQREQYLHADAAVADNQMKLWRALESVPQDKLRAELAQARDPVIAGWIELALTTRDNAKNATAITHSIAEWRAHYPQHPAGKPLLDSLTVGAPAITGRIEHIALLLPLTSDYALAAQAVRDGFLAMHSTTPEAERPKVTIYDLGANPALAPQVYDRAVREGAQVIVGPLGREATDTIVRQANLGAPTLLLSHTDEKPAGAARLFQFGLPPEQEAREAAERAYLDGCRQAAMLYPTGAWGERMSTAFSGHWQRLGGLVQASHGYNENEVDFSGPIKQLLNIVQSEERRALIERRIGQRLQFDPRPRHDIQCLFLAAKPRHARLIKPQLNYFHAGDIPVYATSDIYAGRPDPAQDADLDGIQFGDMPWMLINSGRYAELRQLQTDWRYAHTELDRLYALGMDSYAILSQLNRISTENSARFAGVTSGLSLDSEGRLQRQLAWAKFRNGVPRLLDAR